MTKPLSGDLQFFFGTLPQPCPYLPNRLESKIVTELGGSGALGLHEELSRAGFRRSHGLAYIPACIGCQACIPVRVPVADFEYSRSLRRVWHRNKNLTAVESPAQGTAEQYAVFARYQQWRHGNGGMATMNLGDYKAMVEDTPIDTFGGRSFIINHKGQIVGKQEYGAGSTYVAGVIDIEAMRDHRARAQWNNWIKDLRTELYQIVYDQPIYPKNLYLDRAPMKHAEYREKVNQRQIDLMHERDIWVKPGR